MGGTGGAGLRHVCGAGAESEPGYGFTARARAAADFTRGNAERRPLMGARAGFTFWIRGVQALALAVAVCFSMGATDAGSRTNNLSHRLMCQCGCAQLLGECDHVGCPDRDKELGELSSGIASGASDQQILDSFVAKYGAVVLAAPTTH
jgi:hypothetical protein